MLLADTMVAMESDGTFSTKKEYLAGIKADGDTAVTVGVFRIKGVEKGKPYIHRERTINTWTKINGSWKCVAAVAISIPNKQ